MPKKKPQATKKAETKPEPRRTTVATNRRARFDYEITGRYEAGIMLSGPEIKSVRQNRVQLQGAFARIRNGEAFLEGMIIAPYSHEGYIRSDPVRARKLLLHRREIVRLASLIDQQGLALVPLSMYLNNRGIAKVELGLGRGMKRYDKRQRIREREEGRQVARQLRHSV